ncbi:MAG: substrate-binding domain-containing protein, partial [Thermodesulfovibrionales bacterium]
MLVLCAAVFTSAGVSAATEIVCASTTSTENSGLFGYLLPLFEKKTGIRVKVVSRGTGAAIEIGKRGDA